MDTVIVTTESRLIEIIEIAVGKFLKVETPKAKAEPQRFDFNGTLDYLKGLGYTIGDSKLQKLTAMRKIPCSKFNNRLVFERSALDAWVQSQTIQVADDSEAAALMLARSASNKLRRAKP